jgi:hypothetical protein
MGTSRLEGKWKYIRWELARVSFTHHTRDVKETGLRG